MHQRKWLAVVNEHAGGNKAMQKWPVIHKKLSECGVSVDTQITEKAGDALRLTRKGLQGGYSGIIAVGGDGTLNEAVNGFWHEGKLINPAAVLTFVNFGTGGDFARTVNAKSSPKDQVIEKSDASDQMARLLNGSLQTVDIGLAYFEGEGALFNSRYFINAANVGIGAEAVRRVNADKGKFGGGRLSFLRGALAAMLTYKPKPMRIVVDGECKIDKELYAIMVCNGRFVGAGMMIAPHAEIGDALFDIVAIEKMPLLKLLTQFPKIYGGTHLGVKGVSYWQGSQVEISEPNRKALPNQAEIVELDGEILGCCLASYSLLPQAMTFWLPE